MSALPTEICIKILGRYWNVNSHKSIRDTRKHQSWRTIPCPFSNCYPPSDLCLFLSAWSLSLGLSGLLIGLQSTNTLFTSHSRVMLSHLPRQPDTRQRNHSFIVLPISITEHSVYTSQLRQLHRIIDLFVCLLES